MTMPPWKSENLRDQQDLARFVIDILDKSAELDLATTDEHREFNVRMTKYFELKEEGLRFGVKARPPYQHPKNAPGRPKDATTDFDRAASDVPHIRAIFKTFWNKRNRTMRPLAEEIAAERWGLSQEETVRLIDKFRRKS
ncbi:hypothetical protein [Sphingobium sp. BS19]|uniref:hypothetical protein n=1 Tax=Sphingobium sp. BS19 TaxID=3018973 RepID=UPI0022EEFE83|nr:hypothetical protein [Sphingobium sp. BS19]GLJ00467.1 hypothetical protein Sbs19_42850 [Sphingobium sp. BS19]